MCNAVNWRIADGKTASPFSVFDIFVPLLPRNRLASRCSDGAKLYRTGYRWWTIINSEFLFSSDFCAIFWIILRYSTIFYIYYIYQKTTWQVLNSNYWFNLTPNLTFTYLKMGVLRKEPLARLYSWSRSRETHTHTLAYLYTWSRCLCTNRLNQRSTCTIINTNNLKFYDLDLSRDTWEMARFLARDFVRVICIVATSWNIIRKPRVT